MARSPITLSRILKQRARNKLRMQKSATRRLSRTLLIVAGILMLVLIAAGITFAFLYARLTHDLPSSQLLPLLLDAQDGQLLQPTRFYDRSGEHLLYTLENPGVTRRFLVIDPTQSDSFSPYLVQAAIAAFQPGYWSSPGYNPGDLADSQPRTIAEKLAHDLLLWNEPESTAKALRMRLLAAQLVRTYGRTRVLEWYLNSASFGHYAYGAEAATQLYLGSSAGDLTLSEAAFLVGIARAPALNPLDVASDPEEIAAPVLDAMLAQGLISQEDFERAAGEEILIRSASSAAQPPAYVTLILSQLSPQFPDARLERGGLKVITTIDLDLQQQAGCTLLAQLARLQIRSFDTTLPDGSSCTAERLLPTYAGLEEPLPSDLSASAVILDPTTGELLALVGDTQLSAANGPLRAHEPGSLLTPFIATTAFARGLSPATLVWDVPGRIPAAVQDYFDSSTTYLGPLRLRLALAQDVLGPSARLLDQLGARDVFRSFEAFGLSVSTAADPLSVLFEGNAVSPLSISTAYSAFATRGLITGGEPGTGITPAVRTVLLIEDVNRSVVWQPAKATSLQVLSAPLAYMVHDILSDQAARQGSSRSSDPLDIGRPAGVKYGVVVDHSQVWTVGYTPQRVVAIWLGLPEGEGFLEPQMAGGIWRALMTYAHQELTPLGWNAPSGISRLNVCDPSGLLPTNLCPNVVEEIFITGNEPIAYDDLYQDIQVNRETGRLATVFTPIDLVESHVYLVVPEDVRGWALAAGLPIPPEQYDLIRYRQPDPMVQITAPALFSYVGGQITVAGTAAGGDFLGYRVEVGQGINPAVWQLVASGSQPIENNILARWDTNGSDGLYAIRLQVLRSNQYFDVAVIQVTVDNTPPLAAIIFPAEGAQLTTGHEVICQAGVSDSIGIERVEWWLDDVRIGERAVAPFSQVCQFDPGQHKLYMRAFDPAGNMTQSATITFSVGQ